MTPGVQVDATGAAKQLKDNGNRRGPLGAILNRVLGPLYFWMALYDVHRWPDHAKIKTTAAFGTAVGITISLAVHLFRHTDVGSGLPAHELYTLFGLVVLILFASYGLAGLTIWARTKGGGTVEELGAATREEIAARRDAAAGTEAT